MIFIFLCILINTGLILIFRLFPKYGINSFQAIVANYFVAAFLGYQIADQPFDFNHILGQPWVVFAFILGLLFVSLFYLISVTTVVFGVSVASVANKMSIVIPVTLAVYLYHENLSHVQIIGIVLAMAAVVMVSYKKSDQSVRITQKWHYLLPLILFIGCGSIDALINYLQRTFAGIHASNEYILSTAFMFAAIGGSVTFALMLLMKKITWHTKVFLLDYSWNSQFFFHVFGYEIA